MNDYAWFVWGSYGVTALCLFLELFFLARRSRETKT
jgi:heme exporter protein CcmD